MKHTAKYLDSGFYTVSNRAAGELCRVLSQKLPGHGFQKLVALNVKGQRLSAWLQRTDTCLSLKRKWSWAVFGIKAPGDSLPITLGKSFVFEPSAAPTLGNSYRETPRVGINA